MIDEFRMTPSDDPTETPGRHLAVFCCPELDPFFTCKLLSSGYTLRFSFYLQFTVVYHHYCLQFPIFRPNLQSSKRFNDLPGLAGGLLHCAAHLRRWLRWSSGWERRRERRWLGQPWGELWAERLGAFVWGYFRCEFSTGTWVAIDGDVFVLCFFFFPDTYGKRRGNRKTEYVSFFFGGGNILSKSKTRDLFRTAVCFFYSYMTGQKNIDWRWL